MKRNLLSVAKFCADGVFTEPQVRWWIFNRSSNGLENAGAIVRIGQRIYLDIDGFDRWVRAQNQAAAA